jgi:hypothetical protein
MHGVRVQLYCALLITMLVLKFEHRVTYQSAFYVLSLYKVHLNVNFTVTVSKVNAIVMQRIAHYTKGKACVLTLDYIIYF